MHTFFSPLLACVDAALNTKVIQLFCEGTNVICGQTYFVRGTCCLIYACGIFVLLTMINKPDQECSSVFPVAVSFEQLGSIW